MTEPPPLLEVGRITKAHGVRGEVVVELHTERLERVAPGARLTVAGGELIVAGCRPLGGGTARHGGPRSRFLVHFDGVADRSAAERLRGLTLSAPRAEPDTDDDALWVHELVGCEVVEGDGTAQGRVVGVQANPAADLLVLDSGALVPLTFVERVEGGCIHVDAPAGLFD